MSHTRNFAELGLPDIDSAPQEYQTPDLPNDTDDAHNSRSSSAASSYQDLDQDGDIDDNASRLERPSLQPSTARARFSRSRVDARKADFSDRLHSRPNGRKQHTRSYVVSSKRRRRKNGGEEFANGKFSEDEGFDTDDLDEEETLEQRIARLKREVEEVQAEVAKTNSQAQQSPGDGHETNSTQQTVAHLSNMLRALDTSVQRKDDSAKRPPIPPATAQEPSANHSAARQDAQQTLQQAAVFETRLSSLESALGIQDTSSFLSSSSKPVAKTILASLSLLETQLSIISATTAPSLDTLSRQIATLTEQADRLAETRSSNDMSNASSARSSTIPAGFPTASAASTGAMDKSRGAATSDATGTAGISDATASRIASLHAALPQIERLAPLLPPLLGRLRSLRELHAQAGECGELLTSVEQAQTRAQVELQRWRDGVERVGAAVDKAAASSEANRNAVETWIRQLEERAGML